MVAPQSAFAAVLEETDQPIKVLDLLTNRYHAGLVRHSTEVGMQVELPASAHLCAGQRVRFIVGDQPLVSRNAMRRGFVTQVTSDEFGQMNVRLALLPETAVA